jgi:molecular chaperone GrpE
MTDENHLDGEDSSAAIEHCTELPPEQGHDVLGGIEVFGAAPLVEADATASSPPEAAELPADGLAPLEQRLASIEEQLGELSRMTSHLPPKLRGLGSKLDDLAAPLSDASTRALMVDLFMLDDLSRAALEQVDDPDAPQRTLGAVVKTLDNLFVRHDVTAIPTDIPFDPTLHHAVERLPVDDPAHEGMIIEVYRRGFRSGERVLRFAEVGVAYHEAAPEQVDDDTQPT